MSTGLIQNLNYGYAGQAKVLPLHPTLQSSIRLISEFFKNGNGNKLCLVFPSKEYSAQWLSTPEALSLIQFDFTSFQEEIKESYRHYNRGDKLILNNDAVVEWVGKSPNGFVFKHKEFKGIDQITVGLKNIAKLQPAPRNRTALSTHTRLIKAIQDKATTPLDTLLSINTSGNKLFYKSKICLVSKYKVYEEAVNNLILNNTEIDKYFNASKITENGEAEAGSPLLISNNLSNLFLYLTGSESVNKIIIDGFSLILERSTDFADIDAKHIPTILITDLSEISSFETIGNYGFEFFNYTKEHIQLNSEQPPVPFHSFESKLNKYNLFNILHEICTDDKIEAIVAKLHQIENDESNHDLNSIRIGIVQVINSISRVVHPLTAKEIATYTSKLDAIRSLFENSKNWLGESYKVIGEIIFLIQDVISNLSANPSSKAARLAAIIAEKEIDYIICSTQEEAVALKSFYKLSGELQSHIISVADVNDNLLSNEPVSAILTGWPKSNNINRITSAFVFSELTLLFYKFENNYFHSLQKRNRKFHENIKPTISISGKRAVSGSIVGFERLYSAGKTDVPVNQLFDIHKFELSIENAQYSKYSGKGNLTESIKAKRIEFENDYFIYSTETHKFLIINELIENPGGKAVIYRKKIEGVKAGDLVALINTDKDILAELVKKSTNSKELEAVTQWTQLWKNLLRQYYESIGFNFKKLVNDLRDNDCKKHEVTIKTWLQDENRIGPEDDADLISIALLTNSGELNDNIKTVRNAIRKMTGWRIKAAEFIIEKIKSKIHEVANTSIINQKISIEGLGKVNVLKVSEISNSWENINIKYVHKLLEKE